MCLHLQSSLGKRNLGLGCPSICSVQRPSQGSGFAALSVNNSSGRLLAVPVVLLGRSRAQTLIAQTCGAIGTWGVAEEQEESLCWGLQERLTRGGEMAGDVQREGSREGQGLHGVQQRGYFWCCMHIVFVPVFRLYCLLDLFGLLCSPVFANVTRTRSWWESSLRVRMLGGGI